MMYLFMKLNDETEIVHLPTYEVKDVNGYSDKQVEKFVEIIKSKAHLIIELAKEYGTPKGSE